jgi:hypothetical protein
MGMISEYHDQELELVEKILCICCGKHRVHGGFYKGFGQLTICCECVMHDDLRPLAIAIGDSILDKYVRGHPADRVHTTTLVRSVLKRLEAGIYRAIADGLYRQHIQSPLKGDGTGGRPVGIPSEGYR